MVNSKYEIIVADDDEDLLQMIRIVLERSGYSVRSSYNAANIFELLEEKPTHLLLLDINMKGVQGDDICKQMRNNERYQTLPIFFFSANVRVEQIARECAATGFLKKPCEHKLLLDTVKKALDDHSMPSPVK